MAETLDQKQTHILTLLMLAEADDFDHQNEVRFINHVAGRIGLSEQDVKDIDQHPERLTFSIPEDEQDRMTILYDLLFLMKIDGSVVQEEKDMVHRLGRLLGFRTDMVEEFIDIMSQYVGQVVPQDALLNIIKKYMN